MKEEPENKTFYCYGFDCPLKSNCLYHAASKDLPEKWRGGYKKKFLNCKWFINKNFGEN